MTELLVRRLHPDAQMPAGAYDGDAGLDLASVEEAVLAPGERRTVATGLAAGAWGLLLLVTTTVPATVPTLAGLLVGRL